MLNSLQVLAYPGELIKLRIIPYDEQNFATVNMFEIIGHINHSLNLVSQKIFFSSIANTGSLNS